MSDALTRLVAAGALLEDPRQRAAADLLDGICAQLGEGARQQSMFARLFSGPQAIKGAYIHGNVGRGKTLLMDLFFRATPIPEKRRLHFHEFMDEVHVAIATFRTVTKGKRGNPDPIEAVVRPILAETRLLCLDEFQVSDITNAMLLGRLFEKLFAGGLVLVATSNVAPDDLYNNGLNRQLFLPFIDLLKASTTVFSLDGTTDYRRLKFEGQRVFFVGTDGDARLAMDALWSRLTGGTAGLPEEIHVLGRTIKVPEAAMGVARFPAAALLDRPLGARDYLRLAHAYDALILDDIPQFDRASSNAAKRFILLVDTLYDAGVKLGASLAAPIDALSKDADTGAEFARTVSRLIEMQSTDYLSAPRKTLAPA